MADNPISDFLPQYREVNALFVGAVNEGVVSYAEQCLITDFYHKFEDVKVFEKMVLDIVLGKERATYELILSGIKAEIENNIRLYESGKERLTGIDTAKVCKTEAGRYDHVIKAQMETTNEYSRELDKVKGSLDAIGFRKHTQQEEEQLWRKHDNLSERYNAEKEKLSALYDQKQEAQREADKYSKNLFGRIYSLSRSFLAIIKCYLSPETSTIEAPTWIMEKVSAQMPKIEPDTVFRARMFDRFLALEKRLVADKYLNDTLQWIAVHTNGKQDIRRLIVFLAGLLDNNYFLPNRDPKIKTFFESRYHIAIGQNFEKKRREPLAAEYKAAFYDYPF